MLNEEDAFIKLFKRAHKNTLLMLMKFPFITSNLQMQKISSYYIVNYNIKFLILYNQDFSK